MISCASSLDVMLIADRLGVFSRGLFAANIARFTKPNKPIITAYFHPRDFIAAAFNYFEENFLRRKEMASREIIPCQFYFIYYFIYILSSFVNEFLFLYLVSFRD